MKLYRIAQKDFVKDLTGEGARLFGGRWNKKGRALLYTTENRSLAALEILVHVHNLSAVSNLSLLTLEIPDESKIDEVQKLTHLPNDWRKYATIPELQEFVEDWAEKGGFVLKVPSAIIPEESNYLINPQSDFMNTIKIVSIEDFSLDERLLKR